ncbi:Gfo/Idh/MocA family protein [Streptomyces sp. NPDC002104]
MAPVSLIVVGAGERGAKHARWALEHPGRARVVAVAEPRAVRRERFAAEHGIAAPDAVTDWRELAARGRIADAVLICTMDRQHLEPALAFAGLGHHIMLEKPMALDEASCRAVVAAVERAGVMPAVGDVLRYTPYTTSRPPTAPPARPTGAWTAPSRPIAPSPPGGSTGSGSRRGTTAGRFRSSSTSRPGPPWNWPCAKARTAAASTPATTTSSTTRSSRWSSRPGSRPPSR